MKSIIIIITATIFSFGVGCSQVESLNSDSSDGNSETIIELQDQVNQLQKENTLLMEKYEELENKLNNYNLVKPTYYQGLYNPLWRKIEELFPY